MTTDVAVVASIDGTDVQAGRLYSHRRRSVESATFAYSESYLRDARAYSLDPQLPLVSGSQQTEIGLNLFRAFTDSSPDRWGRNLLLRHEQSRARERGETPRSFGEFELLLGVRDDLRQGALRFFDGQTALAPDATGVPALTELAELLDAADRVGVEDEGPADLALLVRAGSSLGGARPKAHVRDGETGGLAIAKFPSPASDRWNVMAWEKTALDLAAAAGIEVPESWLVQVGGRDVLVVRRFDRAGERRVGYASALTMLEARDGEIGSYLDVAAVIEEHSPKATADLAQLWRRIVFSILISNTDDHLRNTGFLHERGDVWRLSPAFDLNPNPDPGPRHLATAVDEADTRARVEVALRVAPLFRLTSEQVHGVLREVTEACSRWAAVAARHGLSKSDIAKMAPAFEHDETAQARELVQA